MSDVNEGERFLLHADILTTGGCGYYWMHINIGCVECIRFQASNWGYYLSQLTMIRSIGV